ncbi:hypothetical protein BDY21DRAFT_175399 [Lineolata rhizophorae]|uniref:Uncharacterized protein n=1 Tax=Lineolata rhizophorae TaxID=578093 RepID=A0A6A6NLV2_9PEZI|nr:hypothetical protein BDY21DRAFT_175399 [Lineolata rhizophorae]
MYYVRSKAAEGRARCPGRNRARARQSAAGGLIPGSEGPDAGAWLTCRGIWAGGCGGRVFALGVVVSDRGRPGSIALSTYPMN